MNSKTIIIIIVSIVVAVAIGVLSFVLLNNSGSDEQSDTTTTTVFPRSSGRSSDDTTDQPTSSSGDTSTDTTTDIAADNTTSGTTSTTTTTTAVSGSSFTLPSDIPVYFRKSLYDFYGYVPEPDDWYEGGRVYYPSNCPYVLIYTTYEADADDRPVAILGDISYLFPGKNKCTYNDLKQAFGANNLEYSDYIDGYIATYGKYTIMFEMPYGYADYFDIREN